MSRGTKRPPMTTIDKVTYVGELVAFLYDRTQSAIGAIALARAADAALINRRESFETRMLQLTARAMLEFSAIRVARMLDPAEYGNACLPEVFELLADSAVCNAVLDDYRPSPRSVRDRHIKNAFECWNRVRLDDRRERLRKVRSHTLAHNLIHKTLKDGLAGLLNSDLVTYAEEVFDVVDELAWACLGTNQLDKVHAETQQVATGIWQRRCGRRSAVRDNLKKRQRV